MLAVGFWLPLAYPALSLVVGMMAADVVSSLVLSKVRDNRITLS